MIGMFSFYTHRRDKTKTAPTATNYLSSRFIYSI